MADQSQPDTLAQDARFVFRGTVEAVNATTMPDMVPASERTSIVHVDEVLQSPQSLAHAADQQITVLLPATASVSAGEQAVFFTNPFLYGETLAVESLDHRPVPATLAAMTHQPGDPARTLVERDRQKRIEAADLVIRGRVVSVHLVDAAASMRQSEHEPNWQDAVVQVTAVEKGAGPGPEVAVRFPASLDVAWHDAPKFSPGQEGRFVLRRPQTDTIAPSSATASASTPIYTALDRNDFQPAQELLGTDLLSAG